MGRVATGCGRVSAWSARHLAPVSLPTASGPRPLRFHPSGHTCHVIAEYAGVIDSSRYDAGQCQLSEVPSQRVAPLTEECPNARGADLRFKPDGHRLCASAQASATIRGFRVEPGSGLLHPVGQAQCAGEPPTYVIVPLAAYVFSSGYDTVTLEVFRHGRDSGARNRVAELSVGTRPGFRVCHFACNIVC